MTLGASPVKLLLALLLLSTEAFLYQMTAAATCKGIPKIFAHPQLLHQYKVSEDTGKNSVKPEFASISTPQIRQTALLALLLCFYLV